MLEVPPNAVFLDEELDTKYEPNAEEILSYAEWLGMTRADEKYFWIALKGLKVVIIGRPLLFNPCNPPY